MPPLTTAVEMFEELAKRGMFVPATVQSIFEFPTAFQTVPTITTYGTPAAPVMMGVHANAGLEVSSSRNRG